MENVRRTAVREIAPGVRLATPRITLTLSAYLERGRENAFACFSCREISVPKPTGLNDTHGRERRCGACGQQSAVPLEIAARETWLRVIDADGRILTDTGCPSAVR